MKHVSEKKIQRKNKPDSRTYVERLSNSSIVRDVLSESVRSIKL